MEYTALQKPERFPFDLGIEKVNNNTNELSSVLKERSTNFHIKKFFGASNEPIVFSII